MASRMHIAVVEGKAWDSGDASGWWVNGGKIHEGEYQWLFYRGPVSGFTVLVSSSVYVLALNSSTTSS